MDSASFLEGFTLFVIAGLFEAEFAEIGVSAGHVAAEKMADQVDGKRHEVSRVSGGVDQDCCRE